MLKIQHNLDEKVVIRKVDKDNFGHQRINIISDLDKNPVGELAKVANILRKYGFALHKPDNAYFMNTNKEPDIQKIIDLAKKAVAEANEFLKNDNSANDTIEQFKDIIDFENLREKIAMAEVDPEDLAAKRELDKKFEQFMAELGGEIDAAYAEKQVQEFLTHIARFPNYSPRNAFLISLQKPNATKVASKTVWADEGFKPKPNATRILVWRPHLVKPSPALMRKRKKNFFKSYGLKGDKVPKHLVKIYNLHINKSVPATPMYDKNGNEYNRYIIYPVFDISDVVAIDNPNRQPSIPETPKWYTDDEHELAETLFNAIVKVINNQGITVKVSEKPLNGTARGVSSSGKIMIGPEVKGIGKFGVCVHEYGHEIMHQDYLRAKAMEEKSKTGKVSNVVQKILDAYFGRDVLDVLELQAEAVSYLVLKSCNIPNLQYSAKYIALWKGSKDKLEANFDIIHKCYMVIMPPLNEQLNSTISEDDGVDISTTILSKKQIANILNYPLKLTNNKIDGIGNMANGLSEIVSKLKNTLINE